MTSKSEGDCFMVAAKLVTDDPELTLCHGMVWHEDTGSHAHTWVERAIEMEIPYEDQLIKFTSIMCIDKANGNDVALPAGAYYNFGRIDPTRVRRYVPIEAVRYMVNTKHFGPWESL